MHTHPDKNVPASNVLVKHKGLFDFDGFYRTMRAWFEKYRYEFNEKKIKEKPYGAGSWEIEPKWNAIRKVDEYVQYFIYIEGHLWDAKPIEKVVNGEKRRMFDARMTFNIKGTVTLDYTGIFKGSPFLEFMGMWFRKLRHRELDLQYIEVLEYEVFKLQTEMKRFLDHMTAETAYFYYPKITEGEWIKDIR
ncbi:MAG: hypothetical protein KKG59_07460 [Nanoarchaeota archaeon]|nr:hypothetical protein [Nanoarchaeota archaeon]